MNVIDQSEYQVHYDPATRTISWRGSFRLRGPEYEPISDLLHEAAEAGHGTLTLDVRSLHFLNSAGINTLYKFVFDLREVPGSHLLVKASENIPWQQKSLNNLQRILPDAQLELA